MSVLLVQPPHVGHLGLQNLGLVEPLALERLGAALAGPEVMLLDMRLDDDLEGALRDLRPHTVGLACPFTTLTDQVQTLAARVKAAAPEVTVVTGGHHPTLRPEDFAASDLDAIVLGEGEVTFAELVACRAAGGDPRQVPGLILNTPDGQVPTGPRAPLQNLDDLPAPARHLTARWRERYYWMNQRPHAMLETSRGCPYQCMFCSVWRFHGTRVRYQSPARVVADIAATAEPWVFFADDNFLLNVPRAAQIAELLEARGLRRQYTFQARTDTLVKHPDLVKRWRDLGLVCIFLGLEKVHDRDLDSLAKRNTAETNEAALALLKEIGVGFTGNFIADPDWDHADFRELRDYVTSRGLFNSSFSILTPLPGTLLYEAREAELTTRRWEDFDLWHSVLPTRLPPAEFYAEFASLWRAAAQALPPGQRRRRLLKGLWGALTGKVDLQQVRRLQGALRLMSDPASYLSTPPPDTEADAPQGS